MISPRETIFEALLAQLAGSPSAFATSSRKFRMWTEVPPEEQPALFLRGGPQQASESQTFGLPKWTIKMYAFIYCLHDPNDLSPGTPLQALLDTVDANMAPPQPGGLQTLGGLVTNAWITNIWVDEGALPKDTQCVGVVTIDLIAGESGTQY